MARHMPHPKNTRHPPTIRADGKFLNIGRYLFSIFSKTDIDTFTKLIAFILERTPEGWRTPRSLV